MKKMKLSEKCEMPFNLPTNVYCVYLAGVMMVQKKII